jgi:hypothetical protein
MSNQQPLRKFKDSHLDTAYEEALKANIRAFESQPDEWKAKLHGKFAVFHDGGFVGAFETFDLAARMAIKQFQRDCYLIREVGASFTEAQTAFHISSR